MKGLLEKLSSCAACGIEAWTAPVLTKFIIRVVLYSLTLFFLLDPVSLNAAGPATMFWSAAHAGATSLCVSTCLFWFDFVMSEGVKKRVGDDKRVVAFFAKAEPLSVAFRIFMVSAVVLPCASFDFMSNRFYIVPDMDAIFIACVMFFMVELFVNLSAISLASALGRSRS